MDSQNGLADGLGDGFFMARRVAVMGLGLMGGSLALALRGRCAAVYGIDPDPAVVRLALERQTVDQAATTPVGLLAQADLIILAAPVQAILRLLGELGNWHPGPAMVLDLGSTKTAIMAAMQQMDRRFDPLGGHPLCGKERSGLANADPNLFRGAPFAFIPLERTSPQARDCAARLAAIIGAHPLWLDPVTHDRWVAATSHLPYLAANCLAAATPPESAPLAGPGFRSSTRLAVSPPEVMMDVLQTNSENILASLRRYQSALERVEGLLAEGDFVGLEAMLRAGAAVRERIAPQ